MKYYRPDKFVKRNKGDLCNIFFTPIQIENYY